MTFISMFESGCKCMQHNGANIFYEIKLELMNLPFDEIFLNFSLYTKALTKYERRTMKRDARQKCSLFLIFDLLYFVIFGNKIPFVEAATLESQKN